MSGGFSYCPEINITTIPCYRSLNFRVIFSSLSFGRVWRSQRDILCIHTVNGIARICGSIQASFHLPGSFRSNHALHQNDSGHHKVQEHIVLPTDPTPPAYTPESEQSHPALVPTGHIAASAGQECESLLPAHRPFRNRPATYSNR